MKNFLSLPIALFFFTNSIVSQNDTSIIRKEYIATLAEKSPKIDGILDDDSWKNVSSTSSFTQASPVSGVPTANKTEVKIIYDNTAIYVSAMLYDSSCDSICRQLGNRDEGVNADEFRIVFDTYNTEQDAFVFIVTASGLQGDSKFSDNLYNAVWESAVKTNDKGWAVEMKIPFSALRFANIDEQIWGLQITRNTVRNGKFDQWALTKKGDTNFMKYFGYLKGIKNIKVPIRLSLTPYITAYTSHYPANIVGESNFSSNVTGGLDIKYGINESFTVDATLLPDFTQVQSDNVVKNLSAFEVQYDEQRPFFQESTELFQKGDLFYSRRIGRRPSKYYDVYNQTNNNETITKNPDQAKLLNATKVSGRTSDGLGVGLLNAVMDNTYAIARDSSGNERKILTEPFSNYNILVFDKQMKNSSSAYIINTNVTRNKDAGNDNVTAGGADLKNKKGTYGINTSLALSNVFSKTDTVTNQYTDLFGYKYHLSLSKISGPFQFDVYRNVMNPTFNNNGMGITNETNYINNGIGINLFQFEPNRLFLNSHLGFSVDQNENFTTHTRNSINIHLGADAAFKNYYSAFLGIESEPVDGIDYYEARTPGRIFIRTKNFFSYAGLNTDWRKRLSFNINVHGGSTGLVSPTIGYNPFYGANESTNFRANDKLSFSLYLAFHIDDGDRGWVNFDDYGNIVFGVRKITYVENILSAKYLFRNNLSLSLRARHYWSKAHYKSFYNLMDDGHLIDNISYDGNHDFNFNAFNVDMVFQWQFAPGSSLNLVWKNSIYEEQDKTVEGYFNDLNMTFEAKQLNTISLKVLYYFDYLYLRKKRG
ncbi:MAG: DUF5916 domain-containing protein [Bacteroidetes bacterium]|nr:DUF5916 domain-containing protein [Bacteroidota bacterium]